MFSFSCLRRSVLIEHIANAWGDLLVLVIVFCKIDKFTLLNTKLINTLIKINYSLTTFRRYQDSREVFYFSLKITLVDVICYTITFISCRLHITALLLFIGLFLSHQIIFKIVLAITYWFKVDYCFPLFLTVALYTI
jgi:hypothetical protein